MAQLDDDFGDFSSALPVCNDPPKQTVPSNDGVQLDSTHSPNASRSVDKSLLIDGTDRGTDKFIEGATNILDFSVLQQWSNLNFGFDNSGSTLTGNYINQNGQNNVNWPVEVDTQLWPAVQDLPACSSHHQTEYSPLVESINQPRAASLDMKESHCTGNDFGEFEPIPISNSRTVFPQVTTGAQSDQVTAQHLVSDSYPALVSNNQHQHDYVTTQNINIGVSSEVKLTHDTGSSVVDEFGEFATHFEGHIPSQPVSAGISLSTSASVLSLSTSAGIPSVPTSAGIPSVPTSAGVSSVPTCASIPSLPTSAGIPSVPTFVGVPSVPTSAGIPSFSTSAGIPSVPTSAGIPSVPTSAGVPSVPTSAGVPSLATSAGVPSLVTSAGVPSLATSAGVPSLATSAVLMCSKTTYEVLSTAFPLSTATKLSESVARLEDLLDHSHSTSTCTWKNLQKSVDLTVPLYKWDKSYLQETYLSSLKMSSGIPGTSDHLLDAFGFDITAQVQNCVLAEVPLESLLDLGSPTEKRYDDGKLVTVASTEGAQGTSESAANMWWVDPKLPPMDSISAKNLSSSGSVQLTPQARLSPSAQAIFDRLPDVSFMLLTTLVTL